MEIEEKLVEELIHCRHSAYTGVDFLTQVSDDLNMSCF